MNFIKSHDKCYIITKEYFFHTKRLLMHFFQAFQNRFRFVLYFRFIIFLWYDGMPTVILKNSQPHESYNFKEERSMRVNHFSIHVVFSDKFMEVKMIWIIKFRNRKYFCYPNFCIAVCIVWDNWHVADNIR